MNPFKLNRLRTLSVFPVNTIYVVTDTTNDTVTYGICPKVWRALPCEGIILLNITNTPPTAAADSSTVSIDTSRTTNAVTNTTTTSTTAKALLNGSGEQMVNEEITTGNRYLIYYNKSTAVFQTVNHIVV